MPIKLTVSQPAPVSLSYVEAAIKPEVTGHVTPTYEEHTVYPAAGTVFGSVEVDAIPDPTAVKEIDSNGDHDVRRYGVARVDVQPALQSKTATPTEQAQTIVPDTGYDGLESVNIARIPTEYIVPTGTKNISQNGTESVREYDSVNVSVVPTLQDKTIVPTKQTQTVNADSGYDGLGAVQVDPIPSEFIVPTGTIPIAVNGLVDVSQYSNANVQVPQGVFPSGTKQITANGTGIDVTNFAAVDVNVPSIQPTGTLQITQDGTYNVEQYEFAEVKTKPSYGIVLDEWVDGYPTSAKFVGAWTAIPVTCLYATSGRVTQSISKIILPDGLLTINSRAFEGTLTSTLILPDSVTTLENQALQGMSSLQTLSIGCNRFVYFGTNQFTQNSTQTVIFRNNIEVFPMTQSGWFGSANVSLIDMSNNTEIASLSSTNLTHANGCVIRVPQSLLAEWQAATNWNALTGVVWEGV